jgi:hypothetical protein
MIFYDFLLLYHEIVLFATFFIDTVNFSLISNEKTDFRIFFVKFIQISHLRRAILRRRRLR